MSFVSLIFKYHFNLTGYMVQNKVVLFLLGFLETLEITPRIFYAFALVNYLKVKLTVSSKKEKRCLHFNI